jgi:hypothetical protein
VDIPPVPLDEKSASGFAAITGQILNIDDVYLDEEHHFEGPKNYDKLTGYRTQSMLVVPMKDHQDRVIAVLQLLNATNDSGQVAGLSGGGGHQQRAAHRRDATALAADGPSAWPRSGSWPPASSTISATP